MPPGQPPVRSRTPGAGVRESLAALAAAAIALTPALAIASRAQARAHHRGCSGAGTRASAMPLASTRAALLCLVNRERARFHLPRLREDGNLDRSAEHWAAAMFSSRDFAHSSGSSTPGARARAAGFDWQVVGENIAFGYQTPSQVLHAWMSSPGHCSNILDPNYSMLGTGVAGRGRPMWAQDFALPHGRHAPSHNWGPASACPH
jgi:uncharacterized protein YkwD